MTAPTPAAAVGRVERMRWTCLIALACLTGCATYRYDLVLPAANAGLLTGSDPRQFEMDPLQYAVGTAEDRLSVQVYNPTGETIRLSGRDSSVVDPDHHSHPLIDQTIAPRSYVRIVLPPLRPWAGATDYVGESSGIGLEDYGGLNDEERMAYGNGLAGPGWHGGDPGYDRASPVYWDWPGPGDARVRLVYRRADGTTFKHELAFRRRKV